MNSTGTFATLALSLGAALLGTPLFLRAARRFGLLDRPNARSGHSGVTPRGGGVVVLAAAALAFAVAGPGRGLARADAVVLAGAVVMALVGLLDDRVRLKVAPKMALQLAIAAAVVWSSGTGLGRLALPAPLDVDLGRWGAVLAVLWLVGVVNFYNFLDGIDGLAAAQGVVTGLGIALAGWSPAAAAAGAALAGACLGFLFFNWSPARIFLGDAGSALLGYAFAALPLMAPAAARPGAVFFAGISLWLFLADALWTIGRRLALGQDVLEAHREHVYQRLVDSGLPHRDVARGLAVGAALLTAVALPAFWSARPALAWLALAAAVAAFAVELALLRRRRGGPQREARAVAGPRQALRSGEPRGLLWKLRSVARWRYSVIFALDALIVCGAFYLGYALRFEGRVPPEWLAQFRSYLPLLLAIRLCLHYAFGIHRWSFRLSGFHEALRVVLCSLTGSAFFVMVFFFLERGASSVAGPPRSVIVIEFFVTTSLLGALRFSPRLAQTFPLDRIRARPGDTVRAIVVGAGSAGELLLRDLQRSDEHSYEVVGFVDDDPKKWGISLGGRPVLGALDQLPDIVRRRDVAELLFAIPRMPAGRLRQVVKMCSDLRLGYKILPVSFAYLHDRVSASMLQALQPDDLLPRRPVTFDREEIGKKLHGRRVLVTGAGGSIGSEIARQVAEQAPSRLVLLDINENDLYLLYRHLQARHPGLSVYAEVADIRDAARLVELSRRHRPQDVFHAAATKHVPLMEWAPAEAVKTNLTGFRNVVRAAEEGGVERFILISTDKAVDPSSVMGATKRGAELLVRHLAARSPAAYTTVRFGNVLGSAGSVVPLFKAQIAAGGPVTVTHPQCRRYLMTIGEAVGLVLMAGLSGYGDLCILEMGEPILILDLARLMITLAGLVPEDEIPITFTGLRPGEKLDEHLMTRDEEEGSRQVSEAIRVVDTVPPSLEWVRRLEALEALAMDGDASAVVAGLRDLVPGYTPDARWGEGPAAAVGS